MTAPLEGIRVIDWTQVQSGPSCTQMLAWLGADVIKIERKGLGDPTRTELLDYPDMDSLYYLQLNCNKRSIELDMKTSEGKEILTRLLETADIFVENLHPGAVDKLGFSWEEVRKINPRIIYGTIKGFNDDSPLANVKAFEPVAQCAGGAAATTGWYQGEYDIPTQSGAALGDSNTGMHLLIGILAALMQREKTGEGCFVQQSMQDAVINLCRVKLRDQLILEHTRMFQNQLVTKLHSTKVDDGILHGLLYETSFTSFFTLHQSRQNADKQMHPCITVAKCRSRLSRNIILSLIPTSCSCSPTGTLGHRFKRLYIGQRRIVVESFDGTIYDTWIDFTDFFP